MPSTQDLDTARRDRIAGDITLATMSLEHTLRHLTDALLVAPPEQAEVLRELVARAFLLLEHVGAVGR